MMFAVSCKKHEPNSIYEPTEDNKPHVQNSGFTINGDSLAFLGKIADIGNSELLRYGHLWGDQQTLNFIGTQYRDSSITEVANFKLDPIPFVSKTINFDKNKTLFFVAFAINEAGISYSVVQSVYPNLVYERYEIIQEQNSDNKINPGETVKLRFYFKNTSPINSLGTRVSLISNSSSYINSINPLQNIVCSPQIITNFNESFIETELKIDGNTPNINLPIPMELTDSYGRKTTFTGNNIQIKIN